PRTLWFRDWAAALGFCVPGSAWRSLPLHDHGRCTMPGAERAAGAVRQCQITILDLHGGMRLAAQLAHRLDHLGEAATVGRVIVAETPAIGVERQFAGAR